MLALNCLGVPFARPMHFELEMSCIRPPMIRIKAGAAQGLQERLELHKGLTRAATKDLRPARVRMMINRMPPPAWVSSLADEAPYCVDLSFPNLLNGHR